MNLESSKVRYNIFSEAKGMEEMVVCVWSLQASMRQMSF